MGVHDVLDEPTSHLDITSTQVMERALTHFPGAVIVVSHDRFFVDKLADRLLVFDGGPRVREVAATGRSDAACARTRCSPRMRRCTTAAATVGR